MSGIEKLAPDHVAVNAAFPWPAGWPAGVDEAVDLLDRYAPHAAVLAVPGRAHSGRLGAVERRTGRPIPPALRTFLRRHDGLVSTWTGGHPYVAPAADLEGLARDFEFALEEATANRKEEAGRKVDKWKPGLLSKHPDWRRFQLGRFYAFGRDSSGNLWAMYLGAKGPAAGDHPVFQFLHDEGRLVLRFAGFAHYLWWRVCEGHTHPQENDPRLAPLQPADDRRVRKITLKFGR